MVNGRQISFECNSGYFLSTEIHHYVCKTDGKWDNADLNPKCVQSKILKL